MQQFVQDVFCCKWETNKAASYFKNSLYYFKVLYDVWISSLVRWAIFMQSVQFTPIYRNIKTFIIKINLQKKKERWYFKHLPNFNPFLLLSHWVVTYRFEVYGFIFRAGGWFYHHFLSQESGKYPSSEAGLDREVHVHDHLCQHLLTFDITLLSNSSTLTIASVHFLNWKNIISMSVDLMTSYQSLNVFV